MTTFAGRDTEPATLTSPLGAASMVWREFGPPQFGSAPGLATARETAERDARGRLGDQASGAAFSAGADPGLDEAISYARAS
jgi:hypothetical protein